MIKRVLLLALLAVPTPVYAQKILVVPADAIPLFQWVDLSSITAGGTTSGIVGTQFSGDNVPDLIDRTAGGVNFWSTGSKPTVQGDAVWFHGVMGLNHEGIGAPCGKDKGSAAGDRVGAWFCMDSSYIKNPPAGAVMMGLNISMTPLGTNISTAGIEVDLQNTIAEVPVRYPFANFAKHGFSAAVANSASPSTAAYAATGVDTSKWIYGYWLGSTEGDPTSHFEYGFASPRFRTYESAPLPICSVQCPPWGVNVTNDYYVRMQIVGESPALEFVDTNADGGRKYIRVYNNGGRLFFESVSDDYTRGVLLFWIDKDRPLRSTTGPVSPVCVTLSGQLVPCS